MTNSISQAASRYLIGRDPVAPDHPTLRDVVDALFPGVDPRSIHMTSFPGDPYKKEDAKWFGRRLSGKAHSESWTVAPGADENSYLCMGVLDPNIPGRSVANVIGHVAFWLDDVGTKVDRDRVEKFIREHALKPTLVVETSLGNFSYFWAFEKTIPEDGSFEAQTVQAVRTTLKTDGWSDPAVQDAARYMRSGFGVNGKQAYLDPDTGEPFKVRIESFAPGNRVDVEAFASAIMGPDWRNDVLSGKYLTSAQIVSGNVPVKSERRATMDDPLVKLAMEVGLDPQPSTRPGVIDCHCPNEAAHTGGDPTGYAIINDGMSYCHHASCQHLRSPDFQDMMVARYDDQVAAGLTSGTLMDNPFGPGILDVATGKRVPSNGKAFLARARFEGVGLEPGKMGAEAVEELRAEADALAKRHGDATKGEPEKLLVALQAAGAEFFHSQDDRPYMSFQSKVLPIDRDAGWRPVLLWLRQHKKVPSSATKTVLVELMAAEAFAGPKEAVSFRIASTGSSAAPTIYVNLMDEGARAVEITAVGWRVVALSQLPVRLVNRLGAFPMPMPLNRPAAGTPLDWLEKHFNLPPIRAVGDPLDAGVQARAGLLMFLFSQFRRQGATPHLLINGPQGSGKTSFARRLKSLTDPDSVAVVPSLPSDAASLFAIVREQTSVVLDNASKAKGEDADLWCALATGGGHQTRMLYTNSDRSIVSAKVSLIITSIREDFVNRADLMDRTVTIPLVAIPSNERRTEQELDALWQQDLPFILGEIFDLLAGALALEDAVRTDMQGKDLPRLADAALLAESVARAAGWRPMLCMEALNAQRADAADKQLSEDNVAQRVRVLLQANGGRWSGTTEDLFNALLALPAHSSTGDMPRNSRGLTAALDRLDGPLRDTWGILRTRGKRGNRGRVIELSMDTRAR